MEDIAGLEKKIMGSGGSAAGRLKAEVFGVFDTGLGTDIYTLC